MVGKHETAVRQIFVAARAARLVATRTDRDRNRLVVMSSCLLKSNTAVDFLYGGIVPLDNLFKIMGLPSWLVLSIIENLTQTLNLKTNIHMTCFPSCQ